MDAPFTSRYYGTANGYRPQKYDLSSIELMVLCAEDCSRPEGDSTTFDERYALVRAAGYQELTDKLQRLVEIKFLRFTLGELAMVLPDVAVAALEVHNGERLFDYVERWCTNDQKEGKLVGFLTAPHGALLRFIIVEWNTNGVPLLSVEEMQQRYFTQDGEFTPEGAAYFGGRAMQVDQHVQPAEGRVEQVQNSSIRMQLRSLSPIEKGSVILLLLVAMVAAYRSDNLSAMLVGFFCTGAMVAVCFMRVRSPLHRTYVLAVPFAIWALLLINTLTFEAAGTVCGISHRGDGSRFITLSDGRQYDLHSSVPEPAPNAILGKRVDLEVHNLIGDWFQNLPGGKPRYVKDLPVTGVGNNC